MGHTSKATQSQECEYMCQGINQKSIKAYVCELHEVTQPSSMIPTPPILPRWMMREKDNLPIDAARNINSPKPVGIIESGLRNSSSSFLCLNHPGRLFD